MKNGGLRNRFGTVFKMTVAKVWFVFGLAQRPLFLEGNQTSFYLIITWQKRPSLYLSYFAAVDIIGHRAGTQGKEINEAIQSVDTSISVLVQGLKSRHLYDKVNLVIVSDHGMQDIPPSHVLYLDYIIPLEYTSHVSYDGIVFIRPSSPSRLSQIFQLLSTYSQSNPGTFTVYFKDDIPPKYNFSSSSRISEIVLVCEPSYVMIHHAWPWPIPKGSHGYAVNTHMEALFLAKGPCIRPSSHFSSPSYGLTPLTPFQNLDVYPFMARLLDIEALPNNGTSYLIDTLYRPLSCQVSWTVSINK